MKRTRASTLIATGLIGAAIGYLGNHVAVSEGWRTFVPPLTLPFTLVLIGAALLWFAVPIRRAVKGTLHRRIDPFRAARVAVLAKASSIAGAGLAGFSAGIVTFLSTRAVIANPAAIWTASVCLVGATVLVVAALIAEWCCVLPPDDPEVDARAE